MSRDSFMPMFWGDYLRDTGHLSAAEHGAYLLLIGHYWTTGQPLPDEAEKLQRVARMTPAEWRKSRNTVAEFFVVNAGMWRHKRIDAEIARCAEQYERRVQASQKANTAKAAKRPPDTPPENNPNGDRNGHRNGSRDGVRTGNQIGVRPTTQPQPESPNGDVGGDGVRALRFVGARVLELVGVTSDPRWIGSYAPVQGWLAAGCDPELDIFPTVQRVMATRGAQGPPKTINYFTEAVMRAKADRLVIPQEVPANARHPVQHREATGAAGFAILAREFAQGAGGQPAGTGARQPYDLDLPAEPAPSTAARGQ